MLLLHDDRLASPLANTLDMSWVDTRPVSGRILAKILSETHAEGTHLSRAQIEELLEDDQERQAYHRLAIQELDEKEPGLSIRLAKQCLHVLFLRSLKQREDRVFAQLEGADNDSEKLKQLSQELRTIRHQRTNPPAIEFTN